MTTRTLSRRGLLKGGTLLATAATMPRLAAAVASSGKVLLTGQAEAAASRYRWPVHPLLQADLTKALFVRNLGKKIEASLVLDDMETDAGWECSPAVELSYTTERAKSGMRSLRFVTDQRSEEYIGQARSWNGSFSGNGPTFTFSPGAAWARLRFNQPRDLQNYTRLSLWCFPHATRNPISSLCLQFLCEGAESGPYDPVALNYIADLKEGEWNRLVWEIPEYQRDRVSEIVLFQPLSGVPYRRLDSRLTYDFDQLTAERVEPEQVSGWSVRPNKMAYSHAGYGVQSAKRAVCSGAEGDRFELLDAATGHVVQQFPVAHSNTARGEFRVCDFSQVHRPGTYKLRAGSASSESFQITDTPWKALVEATLNAFYGLRCGFAVPGVHEACHCDVMARYKGETRSVGGGWHDAANLSQDTENTNASVVALLDLAEALSAQEPELSARALEEARWGLEWILRMRFAPGIRLLAGSYSYYTDGRSGTNDDVILENRPATTPPAAAPHAAGQQDPFASMMFRTVIGSDTFKNLGGALAEVRGARALHTYDLKLAADLLQAAEEDFATVLRDRPQPPVEAGKPNFRTQPWQNEVGYITLTAIELLRETGKDEYAETALRYAKWLVDVQEFRFIDGSPVTGYFYEDAAKTRILREQQRTSGAMNSFEEGACLAYQALCGQFHSHPDWMRWYEGLFVWSEFFCRTGSAASAPYRVLPAAVWRKEDVEAPVSEDFLASRGATDPDPLFSSPVTPQLVSRQLHEMYEAGTYLSPDQRLRVFPMPSDHIRHGGTTVLLTKTLALAKAAQVRRDADLSELTADQVRWIAGANPFSRSLVYGVGYDWWQNFTVALPNIYGGMAVGMNTYREDAPAWGNNAVFPYKEIWVLTSARMASVLANLCAPAGVSGTAPRGATFTAVSSHSKTTVHGTFNLKLAPGRYVVDYDRSTRELAFLPGAKYSLELERQRELELTISANAGGAGLPAIRIAATGSGTHTVEIRCANVAVSATEVTFELGTEGHADREVSLSSMAGDRAWLVLAMPAGRPEASVEVFGLPPGLHALGRDG